MLRALERKRRPIGTRRLDQRWRDRDSNSQATFILPVVGSSGTAYVLLGDRWNSNNLTDSRYIWQPLTIKGTTVSMGCATRWPLDAAAGTWR